MIKKTITYVDYDGETRTEAFYFNLNKVELTKMQLGADGGYAEFLKRITAAKDTAAMLKVITDLVENSYGEKELDGKRFRKNKELTEAFVQSPAYETLFMELIQDTDAMIEFVKGILPADMAKEAAAVEGV
jgi:hypothetical protein